MEEIWKPIEGYDDYLVSNLGNVKSNITNRILRPGNTKRYYQVRLYKDKKCKAHLVHRLVAAAFIPNGTLKISQ